MLLAGDAAHVHYPAGGQGLSLGVQDAVNLGWKLAQVVSGNSPDNLLDTYHAERHPVAARRSGTRWRRPRSSGATIATRRWSMWSPSWRGWMSLANCACRNHSGLDIHYDLGEGHPLLGRRMPDLDLTTADGAVRVFDLLHDARPLLLNSASPAISTYLDGLRRVRLIDAGYDGAGSCRVLGVVSAPTAVLVRPDGYVAWVGDGTDAGLTDALATWFGPPATA